MKFKMYVVIQKSKHFNHYNIKNILTFFFKDVVLFRLEVT